MNGICQLRHYGIHTCILTPIPNVNHCIPSLWQNVHRGHPKNANVQKECLLANVVTGTERGRMRKREKSIDIHQTGDRNLIMIHSRQGNLCYRKLNEIQNMNMDIWVLFSATITKNYSESVMIS